MKNYNKIIGAVLAGALLAGCNDLDTQPLGNTITSDQKSEVVAIDPDKAVASVTGISGSLIAVASITGDSQSYQWDFGIPATMLTYDLRGIDMYSVDMGYNWFLGAMQLSDALPTDPDPQYLWRYQYNTILACNTLLATLNPAINPEGTEKTDYENKLYAAQGFGYRAFSYLNLIQTFQFTYAGNETAPGVPVLTDENADEVAANGAPRGTVQDVYDQIMSDLNTAISYLEGNPLTPATIVADKSNRFIGLAAAYGLRARANLLMNKWSEAAADAQAAISHSGCQPLSIAQASRPGFSSLDESNWIWGMAVAETDRCVTTGIVNFPSMMGSLCRGYATIVGAAKWINNSLYNSIPQSDVRKGWWLNANGQSPNLNAQEMAYVNSITFQPDFGSLPYMQVKFAPYKGVIGQDVNACDIPLMRVEEMYLILAEAQGMQAPATGAQTLTDFIKTYRDPAYKCTAATAQDLQDEVWRQRRIELWGEGLSYFDLLRLKKPLNRIGSGCTPTTCYNVAADDPVLIYPIPQSEITGNKAINSSDNNPGGSRPTPVQ